MITLINISKTFNPSQTSAVKALDNVSLTISKNDFVVIVGSNGSGKSTLLNSIAGSFMVNEGKILIGENDVTQLNDFKRAKWLSRVFQNPLQGTAPDLSIIDNFRLAALRTKSKTLKLGIDDNFINKVREKVATLNLGLENKIQQPIGSLSGGQRQALTLLMSVMDESKVLLLDEPTAALDPKSAEIVINTANKLTQDMQLTTILVTHNLKEAISYGNRIIQMNAGRIVKDLTKIEKEKLNASEIFSWF